MSDRAGGARPPIIREVIGKPLTPGHRDGRQNARTADLTCAQRLDRARGYVMLMRELRESAWGRGDVRSQAG